MIVGMDDPITEATKAGKSVRRMRNEQREAEQAEKAASAGEAEVSSEDAHATLERLSKALPDDKAELAAAKEVYDEMSAEYRKYIAEKVDTLPIVRYRRRAPFDDNEKRLIAAALMARTPLYKVAQTLRCSYSKIDKAIMDDEYLTELALETKRREKEEVEEGIDDCVRARVPAVLMWKAAKIMPEKYGEQVNMDTEDDTRIVIGAIPEEEVEEAESEVAEMANMVPVVATPALIEANERAAEMAAAGGGVSYEPLAQAPGAPSLNPPAGDGSFRPFVPAAEMNVVDENGNVVERRVRSIPEPEPDPGPDNYGLLNDDESTDFGSESWI